MKKIILVLLLCLTIVPFGAKAEKQKYNTLNLEGALSQEQIEFDFSNYKETKDQITIYLFRGNGCSYCRAFLQFLNSIVPEYGKYFKVVSYETWYDQDNYKFMLEVSNFLGQPATGVPYIIIGDQVFPGYAASYDEQIKKAIVDLYNSKDRYDVLEEMEKANAPVKNSSVNSLLIIVINAVVVILGVSAVIYCDYKQHKILFNKIDSIQNELMSLKNTRNEKISLDKESVKAVPQETKSKKNSKTTKMTTKKDSTKKKETKKNN